METWAPKSNFGKLVKLAIAGSLSGLALDSVGRISSILARFISVCFLIAVYLSANAFDDLRLKRVQ
jgi:hypothetical protein